MKILVQIPFDWDHIKEVPQFLIEKVVNGRVSAFTPSIYAEAYLYEGARDFTARVVSIALTIAEDHEVIPWIDTPVQLYIGAAPRSIKFDEMIVYKQHTLSTQEEYLKTVLHDSKYANLFDDRLYNSSDGSIFFEDLERLAEYIMLLGSSASA
jgi:hypothetical protein